jgi:hypothetical protein
MTATKTESERLAEASGMSVAEVEAKLADGFLFYKEADFYGGEEPPGEWLDAKPTEYVVNGTGRSRFGGYWGRGATVEEAKAQFRKNGGLLGHGYDVIEFGPGSVFLGIGAMGYRYLGAPATVTEVAPRGQR